MTSENTLNLESMGTETNPIPNPEIQTPEKKGFAQEWHELIDKKTGKTLVDPETGKPFGVHKRVEPAWENKPVRVKGFEKMDPTDIKIAQEQRAITIAEYKEPEIIKEPTKNNPQLVKMLADNKYPINDKDVIIRKGNQIIIKKWSNDDQMFHAIALKTDSLGNPVSESKIENFKNPRNYELVPKELIEQPKIERSKTGFILGTEVKAGQVIQQAPYLKVEGFEKKGDKNTIVLLDKKAGKKLRIPVEVFSVMTKLEDLEKNAVYEQADPEKLLEGVQQIGRGVKAENPAVIQQGIEKLQKYQQNIKKTPPSGSKAEEDLAFAKKRLELAQEKIGELTGTEKIKLVQEINTLPVQTTNTQVETLIPEHVEQQQRKIGSTEGEYIPFEEIKEDTKKLATIEKEKTPSQLVADAREAYLALYQKSFKEKGNFKRGLFNIGYSTGFIKNDVEKFLTPEAIEAKKKYDELKNGLSQAMVDRLKAQGKSEDQITKIMIRYSKVATGLDQLEQESQTLKNARIETLKTKTQEAIKKSFGWYHKKIPTEYKKAIGIALTVGIGAATGAITGGGSLIATVGARIARMYVGTKAGLLATMIGEKIWKSGVGGKYETKLEDLKRKYMAGELTPAAYQQAKEGLDLMENRSKTIKTTATIGSAFGAAAGTSGVMNSAVQTIENTTGIDITPTPAPTENTTHYDGWNINLQDYKIDNPPVSEIHTVTQPVEHLQTNTVIESIHSDTGPLQIDTEKLNQQIKDSQVRLNLEDTQTLQDTHLVEDTFGKGNFDATENQYDSRVIQNPEINDAADIETLANQEYDRMINNNFGSANNALWNTTVKNTDAAQFINANPAELKNEYLKLQIDLKTLSTRLHVPPTGNLEGYMKVLAHKLAESK